MKIKLVLIILSISLSAIAYGQDFRIETTDHTPESDTDGRISLRLAGNGSFLTILIGFIPEGTIYHDDGFDGHFINDGAPIEFYSFMGSTRLSIQALPELTTANVQVALGYEFTADVSYTLSIDAEFLSPDFNIILEDTYQGTFTDLRQTGYTFSGVIGEVHDRFFLNLNYNNTLHTDNVQASTKDIHAYFTNDVLLLQTTNTHLKTVELFNIAGERILCTDFKNKITIKGLINGFYIVRCTTSSGVQIIKKILK